MEDSKIILAIFVVIIILLIYFYGNNYHHSACSEQSEWTHSVDKNRCRRQPEVIEFRTTKVPSYNNLPEVIGFQTTKVPTCSETYNVNPCDGGDCLQGQMYTDVPKFEDVEFKKYKMFHDDQKRYEFYNQPCAAINRLKNGVYDRAYTTVSPNMTDCTLYSTADVDPLITGQLYAHSDNMRNTYAQRTSMVDEWGLHEYNSSGAPGDVGVDIGPYGLYEYGGKRQGSDDGIPEQWAFPSTPIRWYTPNKQDYYGPEGPTVYSVGLFNPREPDHIPKM